MLKLKRILAGVLAVSTVFTATACNSNSDSGTTSSAPETTTETTIDDEIENPVDVSNISIDAGEKVEPATLMYMGNYDIRTAGDVKPAYKYFQENYDCDIEFTNVNFLQILEKLTAAISSGESPDLVDYQDNTFPLMMSKNIYTPLEDYMDLSAPQWSGLEDYINKFKWNGHNYYYPWSYDISPYFLIYNRGLFEELGIDDPKELYESGDWTWSTFKECCQKFVDSQDGRLGLYGAGQYSATSFIDSTGTPLLTIQDDGTLVCNLVNADVERATNFMQDLYKEGLAGFAEGYMDVSEDPITEGMNAFQGMGGWIITNYAKKMVLAEKKGGEMDIFFVPFPRDPNADDYYYSMSTFGYLIPAGSKHVEQASVFINCCRLSVTDEALAETTKESIMKNKKYTDEMYEFMQQFKDVEKFNGIVDQPYGLDENTATILKGMLGTVLFNNYEDFVGMSWTQLREANSGAILEQVNYYNGLIKNGNAAS
ncbi:MAG: extracellular solute-binding protein [Ruminiclostridium sp.]|nr:extracellular solute-binding protein [Ruminiclostridium sp.]